MSKMELLPLRVPVAKQSTPMAKFACDFCRVRKLKCSRELPKCSNCRPWPSDCVYSHSRQRRRRLLHESSCKEAEQGSEQTPTTPQALEPGSVEARLDRIESSIAQLTEAVKGLVQLVKSSSTTTSTAATEASLEPRQSPSSESPEPTSDDSESVTDQNPLHSIYALPHTISGLQSIKTRFPGLPQHLDPSNSLHDLTDALASVRFQHDKLRQDARTVGRSGHVFYIPNQAEVEAMMARYNFILTQGYSTYLLPTSEMIPRIIHEPSSVSERGWVVIFNSLLVGIIKDDDHSWAKLRLKLLWNMWLALDDSSLFLQPCLANIYALLTVAVHGGDFTSPNLSWIFIGHACRLAQAMNLHIPAAGANRQAQNEQLILFWGLFAVEKSVSIAFGRPTMMSSSFYENVPLPDDAFLADYAPHYCVSSCAKHAVPTGIPFGAAFFRSAVGLAKLRDKASSYTQSLKQTPRAATLDKKEALQKELAAWFEDTKKELTQIRDNECRNMDGKGVDAMDMCIAAYRFKYYHLKVLVSRLDEADQETCLYSAREAILVLSTLVKESQLIYNGLLWQILYFPFTPFFTLFGNIIRDPLAQTCTTDLEMLQRTVNFFKIMVDIGVAAHKLLKISSMFASLAQMYVQQSLKDHEASFKQQQGQARAGSSAAGTAAAIGSPQYQQRGVAGQTNLPNAPPLRTWTTAIITTTTTTNNCKSTAAPAPNSPLPATNNTFDFGAPTDVSPNEVLSWFDANRDMTEQMGSMDWYSNNNNSNNHHGFGNDGHQASHFWLGASVGASLDSAAHNGTEAGSNNNNNNNNIIDTSNIFGSFVSKGRKRPLECDFDWIGWDFLNSSSSNT